MKRIIQFLFVITALLTVLMLSACKNEEPGESADSSQHIHTEVTDNAVAATCTADGKTAGKHCFEYKDYYWYKEQV